MTLVRYEPWNMLDQLHREMNQLFDNRLNKSSPDDSQVATADWVPAVDIREEDKRFVIHADIPGVDPKDIEVHMENGILTIKGERRQESEEEREGYKRIERVRGSFFRRFCSLPDTADAEAISAKARDGVLEVIIPKHEQQQPRRIQVES
ncbi:Hsp20/alpha crystallin family protein [Thiohalobacter thiocyanaticus]|uniref:Hsp20/alpha crystallin family protein n=1 Tax=Thiohalobacter thiocyanaticus TaxID=585455 RepID=A0A426QKE6_9GAMM|nr:Hsp20/alpha crystallin family protein [Thiohalobacter thiocyanaticus]RRQ22244.1 Hsp20/alpha crystallin family protein [Thiohalobacter thiocyanaticus]